MNVDDTASSISLTSDHIGAGKTDRFTEMTPEVEQDMKDMVAPASDRQGMPAFLKFAGGDRLGRPAGRTDQGGTIVVSNVDGNGLFGHQS